MKNITICLCFFLFTIVANSQLQFVGSFGSSPLDGGSVFGITSTGTISAVHPFEVTDPKNSGLFAVTPGPDGRLYGLSSSGGNNHKGAIYAMNQDGTGFTILYHVPASAIIFSDTKPVFASDGKMYLIVNGMLSSINPDGTGFTSIVSVPLSTTFAIDNNDWLYGSGRMAPNNIVYKIKTDGTGYEVLHTFTNAEGTGTSKGLLLTPTGRLFGAMNAGGVSNGGTLFSLRTDGTDFIVNKTFLPGALGSNPNGLLSHMNGKIFGTTPSGGTFFSGTIYSFDTTTLVHTVISHLNKRTTSGVTPGANGKLYGTGIGGYIFSIDPDGNNYQELFTSLSNPGVPSNDDEILYLPNDNIIALCLGGLFTGSSIVSMSNTGLNPVFIHQYGYAPNGNIPGGIIKDISNKLYGVVTQGGVLGGGLIYSMDFNGNNYVQLHDFADPVGRTPAGKLLLASDGKLYGLLTTMIPGIPGGGIYRINTDGTGFEIVKPINPFTEGNVGAGQHLVEGPGGELYGITSDAFIYRVQKDGSGYTILKSMVFPEGQDPQDGLIRVGNFLYGTCGSGGTNQGTAFRINVNGTGFQVLKSFAGSDGAGPVCGLTAASNGRIYGATVGGGAIGRGTIFSMNPDGTGFTVHHSFGVGNGFFVMGRLIQASDGKLYGTCINEGSSQLGTIFSINLNGTGFTVLHNINNSVGRFSNDELVEIPLITLPLTLSYFVAQEKDTKVKLSWSTSEEMNTAKFIVERNTGTGFSAIATVQAAGNSSLAMNYSVDDVGPVKGENFYRLKMIDVDGGSKYSVTRLVDLSKSNPKIRLYPNPTKGELTIESNFPGRTLSVLITDLSGKILKRFTVINAPVIPLRISALAKGIYTLSITDGAVTENHQLIRE